MKNDAIIFDFSQTLAKMRPARLLMSRRLLWSISKKYKTGIITGGRRGEVKNILRKLKISEMFPEDYLITKGDSPLRKPDPNILKGLIRKMAAGRPVYVGDSKNDRLMAEGAGVKYLDPDDFRNMKW